MAQCSTAVLSSSSNWLTAGAVPVPHMLIRLGLAVSLSVIRTVPLMDPAALGVKVTVIVHCAFTGKLLGQLLICAKGAVVEIATLVKDATPVLVKVEV